MRFFLQVMILGGLIVIGKIAQQAPVHARLQSSNSLNPKYPQYIDKPGLLKQANTKLMVQNENLQKANYNFNY